MPATFTGQDAALQESYLPLIQMGVYERVFCLRTFKKSIRKFQGRRIVGAMRMGRNQGGAAAGSSTLPAAQNQRLAEFRVPARRTYWRIQVEGFAADATQGGKDSFASILADEIKGAIGDLSQDLNRQFLGDGYGKLGEILSADDAADTVTMRTTGGTGLNGNVGADNIRQYMSLITTTGANPATDVTVGVTELTVSTIDFATGVVTFSNTPNLSAVAAGHSLYRRISATLNSQGNEKTGIGALVDDGTILGTVQNLSRTTYPAAQAIRLDNSGTLRDLTAALLQQLWDGVQIAGGGTPDFLLTTPGVRRVYLSSLVTDRRFAPSGTLEGGFKEMIDTKGNKMTTDLVYNGVPVFVDRDVQRGRVYAIVRDTIRYGEMTPLSWFNLDGRTLRNVAGTDDVEGHLREFGNLFVEHNFNCNGVLVDLNDANLGTFRS